MATIPEGLQAPNRAHNLGTCGTLPRQQRTDGATPIAPLGRSDGETEFRIRATMLSIYGRTRLQMESEVKRLRQTAMPGDSN